MAFDWLVTNDNIIEVREAVRDRNEDVIGEIVIGHGYGVFRGQNQVEYVGQSSGQFSHVGTLLFYAGTVGSIEVDGKIYESTHMIPQIGDSCTWRGTRYEITGVDAHPDVHGDLVGYTVRCASGANRSRL